MSCNVLQCVMTRSRRISGRCVCVAVSFNELQCVAVRDDRKQEAIWPVCLCCSEL